MKQFRFLMLAIVAMVVAALSSWLGPAVTNATVTNATVTNATVTNATVTNATVTNEAEPTEMSQPPVSIATKQLDYGDKPAQYGRLTTPAAPANAAPHPVVILVHGGFWSEPWDVTLMTPIARDLADRGYASWNIEFRRLGGHGGWPSTFDDVGEAIDFLASLADEHNLDVDRTVLVGHSSGGHLALWALGRDAPAVEPVGAVGLGAITDLALFPQASSLLGGTVDEVPERYLAAAPVLDPARVRLIHGGRDRIIPEQTLAAARRAGVPVSLVDGADHFDVIAPGTEAWEQAVTDITALLQHPLR